MTSDHRLISHELLGIFCVPVGDNVSIFKGDRNTQSRDRNVAEARGSVLPPDPVGPLLGKGL